MSRPERIVSGSEERSLAEFLVGNSELEQLSAKLNEFNILQVLRIEQAEIRHSNVLGWLLNPRESHGLNDVFVKRFISTLLLDNEQANFDLSPATVELMNFVDVEVLREWRNLDLVIYSKENHLVVVIENKIRAKESKGQLLKYIDIAQRGFPDAKTIIPLFLTLEGDGPSEMAKGLGYISWSHLALYKVAEEVIAQQQNRIPQDAQTFLRHYLTILRRETMQDEKLKDLCKAIYRKHKAAIDLIVQYGAATTFGQAVEDFIAEHTELEQLGNTAHYFWFIPKEWSSTKMPREVEGWGSPCPISFMLVQYPQVQKVGIILEIGPWSDADQRSQLVKAFNEAGFKTSAKSYQQGAKYTRVYSRFHVVRDFVDSDEVRHTIDELWKQSKDKLAEATKVVNNFIWKQP